MEKLYRTIDVWRRGAGVAVRYRCFQVLASGAFCIQSVDSYRISSTVEQVQFLDRQFLELLIEQAPDERNAVFSTIEEAIAEHDREFGIADADAT
jgi:hypothetical protein